MNRALQLTASACALAIAGSASAQSNVRVYGVIDQFIERADTGRGIVVRQGSGAIFMSRWGITGSEDMGDGLKAHFKLESGFDADTGVVSRAWSRESSVGLESPKWGRVDLGRMATQINEATSTFWMGRYGAGAFTFSPGTIFTHDNGIRYIAPKLGNVTLSAHYDFGEKSVGNAWSLQGVYRDDRITALAGYFTSDSPRNITTPGDTLKLTTLAAAYNFGKFQPLVMWQGTKSNAGPAEVDRYNVNLGLDVFLAEHLLRFEYEFVKDNKRSNADAKAISVRYDHRLSKRTTLYAGAVKIKNDAGVYYPIVGASGSSPVARPIPVAYNGTDPNSLIFGISHAF
jgi:predicted porin